VIRGTTTFSPSERAANVRMVVLLVAVGCGRNTSCVRGVKKEMRKNTLN
jgi:hypothetical protein